VSCTAILWALDQPIDNIHYRMVLIALADFYNEKEDKAWPSHAALAERAKTNRRTVIRALAQFEADGLIIDAGRRGRTLQVKVWKLPIGKQMTLDLGDQQPKPKGCRDSHPLKARKGVPDDTLKGCLPVPERVTASHTEPVREPVKSSVDKSTSLSAVDPKPWKKPDGVEQQVWADLLSNRKRKHCGNTPTAWKRFNDDLTRISAKTGIPPPTLIENAAANGWAGIYEPREEEANGRHTRQTRGPTREVYERLKLSIV
jgi:hypothetical protein